MLSVFLLNVFGYFISSQFNGFLAFMVTFKWIWWRWFENCVQCQTWQTDKSWPILSAESVRQAKAFMCHRKNCRFLSADKNWLIKKYFQCTCYSPDHPANNSGFCYSSDDATVYLQRTCPGPIFLIVINIQCVTYLTHPNPICSRVPLRSFARRAVSGSRFMGL